MIEREKMRYARWHLRSLLITLAVVAALFAGVAKWRRYVELRDRIATYSREERLILAEYRRTHGVPIRCGNASRYHTALLGVAAERRRLIEECEREIKRLW
jgi:hypothetical protein